jgi:hypothetical protein
MFYGLLNRSKIDENNKVPHYYIFAKYKNFLHKDYNLGDTPRSP